MTREAVAAERNPLAPSMRRSKWLVLSPHLDDAVLSCGGLISALRNRAHVEIWTLFSGAPLRGPYSAAAEWLHGVSGGSRGAWLAWRRRREDRAAASLLGAQCRHFNFRDAVYRKGADGSFLYAETQAASWHPGDEPLIHSIEKKMKQRLSADDVLLVPLAVGGHVDHLIVRQAAENLGHSGVLYFPDIPYVKSHPGELSSRSSGLLPVHYKLDADNIAEWTSAVHCYATQLSMLEEAAGGLSDLIRQRAAGDGLELFVGHHTKLPQIDIWAGQAREPVA